MARKVVKKRDLLGAEPRRAIDSHLQMISNGRDTVNIARAEFCSSIKVEAGSLKSVPPGEGPKLNAVQALPQAKAVRGKQSELSGRVVASVFIHTRSDGKRPDIGKVTAGERGLFTAEVPLNRLKKAGDPSIRHVELAESLQDPTPVPSVETMPMGPRRVAAHADVHQDGKDVLIGVIDVGGFDFSHPDFLKSKFVTRWVSIWDQGGTRGSSPRIGGQAAGYGTEISHGAMNKALREARAAGVRPTDLEPQSQMVMGAHGTHVASIAAGNSGVCSRAKIAGVLVTIPPEEDPRKFVLDSTRIAHAVDYLLEVAALEQCKAVCINISLGTNGGAHDGTSGVCRWIDNALGHPGRCVTIAAGNSGQEAAQHANDIAWMMGRIHTSGRVEARGLSVDIEWEVFGNSVADVSENELQIWYSPQDRFRVRLRPPSEGWIGPVDGRDRIENQQLTKSKAFVSLYNDLYHPLNGANCISIYLSPFLGKDGVIGVPKGVWTVRLEGVEVKDGRFHGWIERDDPRPLKYWGDQEGWNLPSCFTPRSNVDQCSISTLACTRYAISVANLDSTCSRVHVSSSQGPTRDAREKPDIAAPGTDIVAAKGFAGSRDLWVGMTGTSMASPYVCGVAGLMLACNPDLTSAQVQGMMLRTATPLPGDAHCWNDRSGFGEIDAEGCVKEAVAALTPRDRTRD